MPITTNISAKIKLENVTKIERRGIGPVYRAIITMDNLYRLLKRSVIQYAPKYQRGFKTSMVDVPEYRYMELMPLHHPELQLNPKRAQVMAVKYLQGKLFTSHVTWNARKENDAPEPKFDDKTNTLTLETTLTVPDTGHRHLGYYTLSLWHYNSSDIPEEVDVDGTPVSKSEILDDLEEFDPKHEPVYVEVYSLSPEMEGYLYDEFNADAKPPATAVALDLNPQKTPSRRFVYNLMDRSEILARDEIECRRNTIGSKSRKLTTNSTLEASMRPFQRQLAQLEKNSETYDDLLEFFCDFFEEWSRHFEAWRPAASAEARWKFRDTSFALSNIILHPLCRLTMRLWQEYNDDSKDWTKENGWKDVIAKIAGDTKPEGKSKNVPVMSRENTDWKGKILIETLDRKTGKRIYSLSNTRQTREAAYQYFCEISGVGIEKPKRRIRRSA
jgi:hypothetical protein